MKKYILAIVCILTIGLAFGYTPTKTDTDVLSSVYPRLDKIIESNRTKAESIMSKISGIKEDYVQKQELYYILGQMYDYLSLKLNLSEASLFSSGNVYEATVMEIVDGDTIKVQLSGTIETIRMIGIDSPESYVESGYAECGGKESLQHIKSLLASGDIVSIETDFTQGERDKYSRILAFVFLSGANINEQMIKDGYAWEYTYNKDYKYKDAFLKAQDYAKQNKLGIFSENLCDGEKRAITGE